MISETQNQESAEELRDEDSIFTIWLDSQDEEPSSPKINASFYVANGD